MYTKCFVFVYYFNPMIIPRGVWKVILILVLLTCCLQYKERKLIKCSAQNPDWFKKHKEIV